MTTSATCDSGDGYRTNAWLFGKIRPATYHPTIFKREAVVEFRWKNNGEIAKCVTVVDMASHLKVVCLIPHNFSCPGRLFFHQAVDANTHVIGVPLCATVQDKEHIALPTVAVAILTAPKPTAATQSNVRPCCCDYGWSICYRLFTVRSVISLPCPYFLRYHHLLSKALLPSRKFFSQALYSTLLYSEHFHIWTFFQ